MGDSFYQVCKLASFLSYLTPNQEQYIISNPSKEQSILIIELIINLLYNRSIPIDGDSKSFLKSNYIFIQSIINKETKLDLKSSQLFPKYSHIISRCIKIFLKVDGVLEVLSHNK